MKLLARTVPAGCMQSVGFVNHAVCRVVNWWLIRVTLVFLPQILGGGRDYESSFFLKCMHLEQW